MKCEEATLTENVNTICGFNLLSLLSIEVPDLVEVEGPNAVLNGFVIEIIKFRNSLTLLIVINFLLLEPSHEYVF